MLLQVWITQHLPAQLLKVPGTCTLKSSLQTSDLSISLVQVGLCIIQLAGELQATDECSQALATCSGQ